ncbi:MAG: hypothetical protein Tsb0016_03430 [Sphingomonadales bacterium]
MTLETRIAALEAREEIRNLVARYCFVIDDRDIDGIAALMAPDAVFRSADGVMNARGRDAIIDQFHGRFAVLGMTNHFTHNHVINIDGADHGHGLVNSHAELYRNGRPMIVALRYQDRYVRHDGAWLFAERLLSFGYYLDVADYEALLGAPLRMRAYAQPQAADWPEATPSYQAYCPPPSARD